MRLECPPNTHLTSRLASPRLLAQTNPARSKCCCTRTRTRRPRRRWRRPMRSSLPTQRTCGCDRSRPPCTRSAQWFRTRSTTTEAHNARSVNRPGGGGRAMRLFANSSRAGLFVHSSIHTKNCPVTSQPVGRRALISTPGECWCTPSSSVPLHCPICWGAGRWLLELRVQLDTAPARPTASVYSVESHALTPLATIHDLSPSELARLGSSQRVSSSSMTLLGASAAGSSPPALLGGLSDLSTHTDR